ncbi:MAG: porin [Pseudomonadota bacterium]
MKKSLIALAALATAGFASAQSSVELFGIVDAGFARVTGSNGHVQGLSTGGGGAASRIGFRGTEDLGGGLKAGFWLEAGLNNDSGAGGTTNTTNVTGATPTAATPTGALTFNRRSTVSLITNAGEVRLGRDFTPAYLNETAFDPFGNNGIGTGVYYQINAVGDTRLRASNQISYILPSTLGGLYGQLSFAPSEQASNTGVAKKDGRDIGARLGYAAGPLDVAAAYSKVDRSAGGLSNDAKHATFGASFNFGVAKVLAQYSLQKVESVADREVKGFLVGATAPLGSGLLKATYSQVKDESTAALDPKSKKFAIGYDYNLSKRTKAYATYARIKNSDGASLTTGSTAGLNSLAIPAGLNAVDRSSNGYEVGVRHSF